MTNLTISKATILFIFVFFSATLNLKAQSYNSELGNCTIKFPGEFVKQEQTTDNGMKTAFVKAKKNDQVFMFKYVIHRDDIRSEDPKSLLEISALGFAKAMNGTQKTKNSFSYKNYEGLETFIKISEKNLNVFYRVIFIGNIQYQLFVISPSENKTTEINNYFDSFVTIK